MAAVPNRLVSAAALVALSAWATPRDQLTVELVPLDRLAQRYHEDANRIEVFYPRQFQRLEMSWDKRAQKYLREFARTRRLEDKIDIFARLYNSYHNAHHRPLTVKGIRKSGPDDSLVLPFEVFGQGIRISDAHFFVADVADATAPIRSGDEIVGYDGRSASAWLREALDEVSIESPEAHISYAAKNMWLQRGCSWGKLRCWQAGDEVLLRVRDATGNEKNLSFRWQKRGRRAASPGSPPQFPPDEKGWTFQRLDGPYAIDYDSLPEPDVGFIGVLTRDERHWLVIKIFRFRDLQLVQRAIVEARKPGYLGVILDFGDNAGGNDSAMTLLAGLLGTKFHLELSAIRLVKELRDLDTLEEATFSHEKASFLAPYLQEKAFGQMSPLMPFGCLDAACPLVTEYSSFIDHYDKPAVVSAAPVPRIALVTGRGTASKSDSIAALFRATRIGPIVGTPAIGSSGTYYFKKDYVVPIGQNAITLTVTFTPDYSIAGDCQEVQANPPTPDVLVERTFANRSYYDTLTWIRAAEALDRWAMPTRIDAACAIDAATAKMKGSGLTVAPRAAR